MKLPDLKHETELWEKGFIVIGVDEVGRGAFAGPLHVGGVIFHPTKSEARRVKLLSYGINDSKKLSAKNRELLTKVIQQEAFAFHVSKISVTEINRIGVGKATFCAMRDVVKNLINVIPAQAGIQTIDETGSPIKSGMTITNNKTFVLVDGFYIKNLRGIGLKNQRGIVHGDGISLSIAAASIIAKVERDAYMTKLSEEHPEFDWEQNKGYGTLSHREALSKHGSTHLHRTAFIKNFI